MSRYPGGIITKSPATPTGPTTVGRAPGVWRLDEVAYWVKQGVWPNANIAAPDTYFPYVSLLLSTTSLSNANNNLFVDSSGAFNPIARNGNATQGSVTPYGVSWSNFFDGSNAYLTSATSSAYAMGTGDFTIEGWFFTTASADQALWDNRTSTSSAVGVACRLINSTNTLRVILNNTALFTTSQAVPLNQWNHIAVVRASGTVTAYLNGTAMTGGSASGTTNITDTNMWIGKLQDAGFFYNGYISNVRVVKGTAVYTAAFTPPTAPLTAITNTSLLTCQSNRFRDASTNNFTITPNGNTSVTEFSPFAPAYPGITYNQSDIQYWSGYFDGTGDYLTVPDDAALDFGTGDFTIEMWINAQNLSSVPMFFHKGTSVSTGWFFQTSGTTLYFGQLDSNRYSTWSVSLTNNAWYHIALTRVGAVLNVFVNGVSQGAQTVTNANLSNDNTGLLYIGEYINGTYLYQGYLSNYRVVKGTAVYTSNFTPSTTPLTAISGTSLLTCQSAAFTDNSTNNFVVTIVGNTTVTGNNPFQAGYYSNSFDGSGDYFTVPYTTANFDWYTAGVDFTIEYWFFANSLTGTSYVDGGTTKSTVVGNRSATTTTDYWSFGPNASGTVTFYYFNGGPVAVNSTSTITANTWNHIAMTKTSSGITIFVNGVAQTTTAISGTPQSSASFPITVGQGNNTSYNGYVSNLRIVRGTAIYSGNFTVPTAPLTAVTNTKLLTCQSARFIDNSTNNLTLTLTGNTSIQPFDPFYTSTIASNGGSMYFDGSGDYLTVPYAGNMQYAGNFTIECWVFPIARVSTYPCIVNNYSTYTTNGGFAVFAGHNSANTAKYQVAFNGSFPVIQSTSDITYNAWSHIALVRSGSTITLYVNGVSNGTATSSATVTGTANSWWVATAGDVVSGGEFNGYISSLRASPSAVYTAAFTPPTAPVTPSANTTLLLNGMNAGAYDATAINDMETVGNAQVSTAVSKFGGSSMYFDGTGDYLTTQSSATLGLGSGDFTVEAWIYPTGVSGTDSVIFDFRSGNSGNNGPLLIIGAGGSNPLVYVAAGSARITGSGVTLNTWSHVAVSRSGTSTRLFLNGVQTGSTYTDTNNYLTPARVWIGADDDGSPNAYFIGYIDDLRITKGVARYTANFTPPTQAFPTY